MHLILIGELLVSTTYKYKNSYSLGVLNDKRLCYTELQGWKYTSTFHACDSIQFLSSILSFEHLSDLPCLPIVSWWFQANTHLIQSELWDVLHFGQLQHPTVAWPLHSVEFNFIKRIRNLKNYHCNEDFYKTCLEGSWSFIIQPDLHPVTRQGFGHNSPVGIITWYPTLGINWGFGTFIWW